MLKQRVITAVILLLLLVGIFWTGSYMLFAGAACLFFAAASWEALRLSGVPRPGIGALLWTAVFAYLAFRGGNFNAPLVFAICAAIWALRLTPTLAMGLPARGGIGNRLLSITYGISIFGCFLAILVAFRQSILFLFSCMAVVWVADIGAYFAGKAFGKRKLAPSISPGKSWEGAIGGWLCVVSLAGVLSVQTWMIGSFPSRLLLKAGWLGFVGVLTIVVAASIIGDLFESQLKRRADMKDSSNLLPGHGGVLDRVDALIPAMPLMLLADTWL